MTNFEKITTYLKHGIHVGVKDKDGDFLIISPTKDEDGDFRATSWCDTLEDAKQNMGEYGGFRILEEGYEDWTDITPFHLGFEPYPNGMKVKIIKTGTVDEVQTNRRGAYQLINYCADYSHTELIPYFEEEKVIEENAYTEELNYIKKLHQMELDAISLKSLDRFMLWAEDRKLNRQIHTDNI